MGLWHLIRQYHSGIAVRVIIKMFMIWVIYMDWNLQSSEPMKVKKTCMCDLHEFMSPIILLDWQKGCRNRINAYYIFVHPYLPLLPPPIAPQYEDRPVPITITHQESFQAQKSFLPHWPTSPLTFALSAILVLIPPPQDLGWANEATVRWRRSYAELYMSSALESVEGIIDTLGPVSVGSSPSMELAQRNPIHSCVPVTVEPVLALIVASVYEYCQRGNITKMRTRANHAVTLAMDIGLHNLDSQASRFSDAQRRAWWVTVRLSWNIWHKNLDWQEDRCLWCIYLRVFKSRWVD